MHNISKNKWFVFTKVLRVQNLKFEVKKKNDLKFDKFGKLDIINNSKRTAKTTI